MLTRQITELQTKIDNSEQVSSCRLHVCIVCTAEYQISICMQFVPSNKDNSQDYSKELSTLRSNLEKQCEENADLRLQASVRTVTPVYICICVHVLYFQKYI